VNGTRTKEYHEAGQPHRKGGEESARLDMITHYLCLAATKSETDRSEGGTTKLQTADIAYNENVVAKSGTNVQ